MRLVRLAWLARLVWGGHARHTQRAPRAAHTAVRPAAWAALPTTHPGTRPRVALAIQAAYAAQTSRAIPGHWATYGWGREPDEQQPARSPFDARRAQAWQAIDLTLSELRAS